MMAMRHVVPFALVAILFAATDKRALAENPASPPHVASENQQGEEFFELHIRPVLAERCYKCHAANSDPIQGGLRLDDPKATRTGGDSGPAIVPGKLDESLLLKAIEYSGDFYDMPPEGKLPADVIANFKRWIEMGAPDPRKAIADKPAAPATNAKGPATPEDLWVLRSLNRPVAPDVKHSAWPKTTIDRFVLANLEQRGLAPAREADRYTLLRRVTYGLTGLPPTVREIEDFLADESDAAWERVVDRLLASPAFGDHWARHWFDLSCYADLSDVQGNVVVQGTWRYRDYVIAALNGDKPFDRFIAEQIAGDLLPYESPEQQREQLIATGFLAIGPWALQNYVKPQLDSDVVDHQVDKISRTFLGMSVRCARCHDHKFDPIPTRDYYALAGIFHSTLTTRYDGPGVWSQAVHRELPNIQSDRAFSHWNALVENTKRERASLEANLQQILAEAAPVKLTEKVVSASANAITLRSAIAANAADREYRVAFAAGPSVWRDGSQATSANDGLLIQLLRADGSVLAHHVYKPGEWTGTKQAQDLQPVSFTYRGDGSGDVTLHVIAMPLHTGRFGGAIDDLSVTDAASGEVLFQETFDDLKPGNISGKQVHTDLTVYAAATLPRWTGSGGNHTHAVNRATNQNPNAKSPSSNIAVQLFSGPHQLSSDPRVAKLQESLNSLATKLHLLDYARPNWTHVLAVQDIAKPHDAPIYVRGNFRTPGKQAPRGALTAISTAPFPEIPTGESGRKELAHWLTDPGNVVTPRVLANRVWQHLFGAGIVQTVDYFGIHGDQPSHPELLDYLAIRFRDDAQWSLKTLVREIVLSNTYRMSSAHNDRAASVDPNNRWLWRMNRRRLTAESIRDGMLAISGSLDTGRGGDALGLEIPGNVGGIGDTVNLPTYSRAHIPPHVAQRRAVYLPMLRSPPDGPLEILSVFDFPHPSEITGQRPERTVATQALFLLNSDFVLQQAKQTANPALKAAGDAKTAIVQSLYLRALNRPAEPQEVQDAVAFVEEFKAVSAASTNPPTDTFSAAWTEFCRALFASNDFLFLE
jgi:hypothetical protein